MKKKKRDWWEQEMRDAKIRSYLMPIGMVILGLFLLFQVVMLYLNIDIWVSK
jgi:hypothetical protein